MDHVGTAWLVSRIAVFAILAVTTVSAQDSATREVSTETARALPKPIARRVRRAERRPDRRRRGDGRDVGGHGAHDADRYGVARVLARRRVAGPPSQGRIRAAHSRRRDIAKGRGAVHRSAETKPARPPDRSHAPFGASLHLARPAWVRGANASWARRPVRERGRLFGGWTATPCRTSFNASTALSLNGGRFVSTRKASSGPVFQPKRLGANGAVAVYENGVRRASLTPIDFSKMPVDDYAAVEFYAGAETYPVWISPTNNDCGVLLLWTRER